MKPQEEAEDSASEGSSFDCTIDISGSPSSSSVFPPQRVRTGQPYVSGSARQGEGREGEGAIETTNNTLFEMQRRNSDVASETNPRSLLESVESLVQKLTVMRVKSEGDYPFYLDHSTLLSTGDINLDVLNRKVDIRIVPSLRSLIGSVPDLQEMSDQSEQVKNVSVEPKKYEEKEQEEE